MEIIHFRNGGQVRARFYGVNVKKTPVMTGHSSLPIIGSGHAADLLYRIGGGENINEQRLRADREELELVRNNLAVIKTEYERVLKLHSRLLELASCKKNEVVRRISALKVSINQSGLDRAEEINRFIEYGNGTAAAAILSKIMRTMKNIETGIFVRYYGLLMKTRDGGKVKPEPDGNITIFMGRHVKVEGTTIVEQDPRTHSLYRWHRILDKIFITLAKSKRKLSGTETELSDISRILFSGNMNEQELKELNARLTSIAEKYKGVRDEELKQMRRQAELAAQFMLSPNWMNMTRSAVESALNCAAARVADIDREFAHLEYVRACLRNIGAERFNALSKDISLNIMKGWFGTAGNQAKQILTFLKNTPEDPDFKGSIGAASRIMKTAFRLVDARTGREKIEAAEKIALRKELVNNAAILADITREGLLSIGFMSAYQPLANDFHLGIVTNLGSDLEVFNKVFKDWWAVTRIGNPRGECYWRAKLYRAVFISERSICFGAAGIVLLILKIDDLNKLRPYLEKHCPTLHKFLAGLKYDHAALIPQRSRDAFLNVLCAAAAKDYKLNTAKPEELAHFYGAFRIDSHAGN